MAVEVKDTVLAAFVDAQKKLSGMSDQLEKVISIPNIPVEKKEKNALASKEIKEILTIFINMHLKIVNQNLQSPDTTENKENTTAPRSPRF